MYFCFNFISLDDIVYNCIMFTEILNTPTGMIWGDWGTYDYCTAGSFATGFRQNV